jgi:hypothetical protein
MVIASTTVMGLVAASPADALTKGAQYLMDERIAAVCPSGGRFVDGVIEKDLTGDGKLDLILDLSGLRCDGAYNGTNGECGAAHCPVFLYVRRGPLLEFQFEVTSIGATVGDGSPPVITLVNFEYQEHTIRWNGRTFE